MTEEGTGILMAGAAVKGATTAVVKSFIDDVISPYLRGMASKKAETKIKAKLSRYARIVESKTRTIPTFANTAGILGLEDIYEPLTVVETSGEFSTVIDGYPNALFKKSRCIAITDDAGMGKSTLVKYIVRKSMSDNRGIPLLIELRRIRSGQSIIECLCNELAEASPDTPEGGALIDLFSRGNFIFVLDGFDEVEEALRPKLVAEINDISARFSFCYFILTSRPEYSVSLFPEFFQAGIKKLSKQQAHSLIRRYDADRGLAKLLIPKIDQARIGYFLGNPLLVTLLYRAFDHRNSVPPKRIIFYRQVYDALFQDHDLGKGDAFSRKKESGLDSEDFHRLIRALGFETFKSGRVSYDSSELVRFIEAACERSDITADPKRVSQDLLKSVPIFLRDGREVKWSHKSFQEYFASLYIHGDMGALRDELIKKMFNSPDVDKYREIFRFLGECDLGLMRSLCISPYVRSKLHGVESTEIPLRSIFSAVDLYYIGNISKRELFNIPSRLKKDLGIDLGNRRIATSWGSKGSSALLGALKADGGKFLLLSVIDPEMFPEFSKRARESNVVKWGETYGPVTFHINPDMKTFKSHLERLGSMSYIEAAANLCAISQSEISALAASENRRKAALKKCVLDDF